MSVAADVRPGPSERPFFVLDVPDGVPEAARNSRIFAAYVESQDNENSTNTAANASPGFSFSKALKGAGAKGAAESAVTTRGDGKFEDGSNFKVR